MTITIDDDVILAIITLFCLYFSTLAVSFPLTEGGTFKNAPGEIWMHLRAMIFPFFAGISWYVFAAYVLIAGNNGVNLLYYFGWMMAVVYFVVGFVLVFYLAFQPLIKVLGGEGR